MSPSKSKPRIPQRDIAERAGVSISTVSRVLNRVDGVSEDAQRRVWEAAANLGYEPGALITAPALQRVMLFRPWVKIALDPFYAGILHGVEAACRRIGANLSYTAVDPTPENCVQFRESVQKHHPDGLVLVGMDDRDWLEDILTLDLPVVLVNAWHPTLQLDTIVPDNHTGPRLAVRHLIEHGHHRILHITCLQRPTLRHRYEAYRAALDEAGIPYDPALVLDMADRFNMTTEGAYARIQQFLRASPPEFSAVFCANDATAIGVMRALQEAGRRIPQDVSIVGYDDSDMAPFLAPPLTTVRIEREELGMLAVQRLADRVANPGLTPIRVELATRLILRESVAKK
ncbi:MAG: LacI family DNA-binding transcriptional regulator [Anaerolineae bacterium]|nr:LacI family DNA-binding transcriptional regulator [Anaerolineae bacterium]